MSISSSSSQASSRRSSVSGDSPASAPAQQQFTLEKARTISELAIQLITPPENLNPKELQFRKIDLLFGLTFAYRGLKFAYRYSKASLTEKENYKTAKKFCEALEKVINANTRAAALRDKASRKAIEEPMKEYSLALAKRVRYLKKDDDKYNTKDYKMAARALFGVNAAETLQTLANCKTYGSAIAKFDEAITEFQQKLHSNLQNTADTNGPREVQEKKAEAEKQRDQELENWWNNAFGNHSTTSSLLATEYEHAINAHNELTLYNLDELFSDSEKLRSVFEMFATMRAKPTTTDTAREFAKALITAVTPQKFGAAMNDAYNEYLCAIAVLGRRLERAEIAVEKSTHEEGAGIQGWLSQIAKVIQQAEIELSTLNAGGTNTKKITQKIERKTKKQDPTKALCYYRHRFFRFDGILRASILCASDMKGMKEGIAPCPVDAKILTCLDLTRIYRGRNQTIDSEQYIYEQLKASDLSKSDQERLKQSNFPPLDPSATQRIADENGVDFPSNSTLSSNDELSNPPSLRRRSSSSTVPQAKEELPYGANPIFNPQNCEDADSEANPAHPYDGSFPDGNPSPPSFNEGDNYQSDHFSGSTTESNSSSQRFTTDDPHAEDNPPKGDANKSNWWPSEIPVIGSKVNKFRVNKKVNELKKQIPNRAGVAVSGSGDISKPMPKVTLRSREFLTIEPALQGCLGPLQTMNIPPDNDEKGWRAACQVVSNLVQLEDEKDKGEWDDAQWQAWNREGKKLSDLMTEEAEKNAPLSYGTIRMLVEKMNKMGDPATWQPTKIEVTKLKRKWYYLTYEALRQLMEAEENMNATESKDDLQTRLDALGADPLSAKEKEEELEEELSALKDKTWDITNATLDAMADLGDSQSFLNQQD